RQVGGGQQVIDVNEGRFRQRAHRLTLDGDKILAVDAFHPHAVGGELAVGRRILAERKQRRVSVGWNDFGGSVHDTSLYTTTRPGSDRAYPSRASGQSAAQ